MGSNRKAALVRRVRAALETALRPIGKSLTIARLLAHGYALSFTAPGAGRLSINAYLTARRHTKAIMVARATATLRRSGPRRITMVLSAARRALFAHATRLKLGVQLSFTPTGEKRATTITKRLTLRR